MVKLHSSNHREIPQENLISIKRDEPRVGESTFNPEDPDSIVSVTYIYYAPDVGDIDDPNSEKLIEIGYEKISSRDYIDILFNMPDAKIETRTRKVRTLEVKGDRKTEYFLSVEDYDFLKKDSNGSSHFFLSINGESQEIYEADTFSEDTVGMFNAAITTAKPVKEYLLLGVIKSLKTASSGSVTYDVVTLTYPSGKTRAVPGNVAGHIQFVIEDKKAFSSMRSAPAQSQPESGNYVFFNNDSQASPRVPQEDVEPAINEEDEEYDETDEEEKSFSKRRKRKIGITLAAAGLLALGIMTFGILKTLKVKGDSEEAVPTPTIEVKVTPEPKLSPSPSNTVSPTATPSPTAKPTPTVTPSPTAEPTPDYSIGEGFVNELKEKGYKYILNGDIISFDSIAATNIMRLISGLDAYNFKNLSDEEKINTILNYQQAILLYCSECVDDTTKGPVDLASYCSLTNDEISLLNDIFAKARSLAMCSSTQPLNGIYTNFSDQMAEHNEEYKNAVEAFIIAQNDVMSDENITYNAASEWYKYLVGSLVVATNHVYIPAYFHLEGEEDPTKIEYMIYFTEKVEGSDAEIRLIPRLKENGMRYVNEENGIEYTLEEVESIMNPNSPYYNPSMTICGVATDAVEKRNTADTKIFGEAGLSVSKETGHKK